MRTLTSFIACALMSTTISAQNTSKHKKGETNTWQVVEAACGECQFGLDGKGCDLAIRMGGKPYFVDGTEMDKHGDAHAKDGFCNAIRKAEVTGKVIDGRFKAKKFKLLPTTEEKK